MSKKPRGTGGMGGGATLGGDADEETFRPFSDGTTDVTYHTPAWHKARIEALSAPRLNFEEWKQKRKEEEGKQAAVAETAEKSMREYRALLDADRAAKLKGASQAKGEGKKKKSKEKKKDKKGKHSKKEKKEKEKKKKRKEKKRRRESSSSSGSGSESSSDSSSSEDERSSKKRKKSSSSSSSKRGKDEPVRLSEFLRS